jgi:hypothetical protein
MLKINNQKLTLKDSARVELVRQPQETFLVVATLEGFPYGNRLVLKPKDVSYEGIFIL